MRARKLEAGFTLVELMVVVAIIGVIAALAVYGTRRYLASAKSAEAKTTIGTIARSASAAYEREAASNKVLAPGQNTIAAAHALCTSAVAVPAAVPAGTRYQPKTGPGLDFDTGTATAGWRCLRVSLTQPIYYRYSYNQAAGYLAGANPALPDASGFEAAAQGDTNNNLILSTFALTGKLNATGQLLVGTQIYIDNESE